MNIPFFKLPLAGNELSYIKEVIDSGWVTSGQQVQKFEAHLKAYINCKYAVAVSSCTAALHLALRIIGIKEGDKVLVPTMTFTSSAETITYLNAIPVFIDIDPLTGLITPEIVKDTIVKNPDAKAIIIVHYAGQTTNMHSPNRDGVIDICREAGLKIIEDCAHSFGGKRDNQHSGTFGDIGCFSFYSNKCFTTGEGGALVTNNESYRNRAGKLMLHGLSNSVHNRKGWEYDIEELGYKYNMSDINAAFGIAQLERVDEFRFMREKIAKLYTDLISEHDNIQLLKLTVEMSEHSWHLFPVLIKSPSLIRNQVFNNMKEKGISLGVHYKPLHLMNAYSKYVNPINNFTGANYFFDRCLSLPIYPGLNHSEARMIIEELEKSIKLYCT